MSEDWSWESISSLRASVLPGNGESGSPTRPERPCFGKGVDLAASKEDTPEHPVVRGAAILGVLSILLTGARSAGAEGGAVDRTIGGQPAYASPQPFYALLLLGSPEPKRVWLVVDGDDLYADRNTDGDLLDPGEKVVATSQGEEGGSFLISRSRSWVLESVASERYTNVEVAFVLLNKAWRPAADASNRRKMDAFMEAAASVPHAQLSRVQVTIDGKRRQQSCNTTFGTTPETAPVFRMDAPLTWGLVESFVPTVLYAGEEQELSLAVGCAGVGPGSFSFVFTDTLPSALRPSLEVEFPAREPGEYLPPRTIELPGRC
jgi:hypothetical protein